MPRRADCILACLALLASAVSASADDVPKLRVCAQSDNFPLSNRAGQGFENKLAEMVAAKMGRRLAYTWWPARDNFIDNTLKHGKCDVIMGAPTGLAEVATTRPYYRGSYVLVSRSATQLSLAGIRDPKLRNLRIGVYLIGNNQTPPAMALAEQGISDNVQGYMTFFDRDGSGHSKLISAVAQGKLDVAAVWGPLVGYYVVHSATPLTMTAITDSFGGLPFEYDIAIGVRKDDAQLKKALDGVVAGNGDAILNLLEGYGVFPAAVITPVAASTAGRRQP